MVADTKESSPSRRRVPSGPSPMLGRMTVRIWPPTFELPPSQDGGSADESALSPLQERTRKGLLGGSSPLRNLRESSPLRNLREKASHVKDEYVKEPLRATAEYVGETRVVGAIRDTAEYVGETRVVTTIRETMSETADYVGETRVVTTIRELLPERRWSPAVLPPSHRPPGWSSPAACAPAGSPPSDLARPAPPSQEVSPRRSARLPLPVEGSHPALACLIESRQFHAQSAQLLGAAV